MDEITKNRKIDNAVIRKICKQTKYGYVIRIPGQFLKDLNWELESNYMVIKENNKIVIENYRKETEVK